MVSAGAVRAVFGAVGRSRWLVWGVLLLPGAVQTWRYRQGAIFYGEYLHLTGELAAELLIVALAVTPLRLAFPRARWVLWLMSRRRAIGVATFGYAALHAGAYLERQESVRTVIDEALSAGMGTGWIALGIFSLLALTSNDLSVRLLGRTWRTLHRAVYPAAALTFAHWIFTAFDPVVGWVHVGVLVALEVFRLGKARWSAALRATDGAQP